MIVGVGTDIVAMARMHDFWERHGQRGLEKILAPDEIEDCLSSVTPAVFLAKRFAAKEALGKAFGTGVRAPLLLPAISVYHDSLGKPLFRLLGEAKALFESRGLIAHLSLSDEKDFAIAFVVLETI